MWHNIYVYLVRYRLLSISRYRENLLARRLKNAEFLVNNSARQLKIHKDWWFFIIILTIYGIFVSANYGLNFFSISNCNISNHIQLLSTAHHKRNGDENIGE